MVFSLNEESKKKADLIEKFIKESPNVAFDITLLRFQFNMSYNQSFTAWKLLEQRGITRINKSELMYKVDNSEKSE